MTRPKIHEFNVITQIGIDREMTEAEYENYLSYTAEHVNNLVEEPTE